MGRINAIPKNKGPMTAVLMIGSFISILNLTLLTTAIPTIMESLQVSANQAQWLNTAFVVVLGVIIPITSYLIKNFTIRQLFYLAMGSFTLGTFLSSIAIQFEVLLAGRVIQAIGAGIMFPLVKTVVILIYPVNKRGTIMAIGGLVASFAPAIGPTLSGWIINISSWRAVFLLIIPISVINMIIAYFVLRNVTEQEDSKLDIVSVILSTMGFGGLLFSASLIGEGKSNVFIIAGISIIISIIFLAWFIVRQLKLEEPMLDFRVFQNPVYSLTTVVAIISFTLMISAETVLPIYMHRVLGYTPLESGLVLLPGALVFGVVTLLSGIIYDRVGVKWLAISGLTIVSIFTFLFTNLTSNSSFTAITIIQTFRMLGISMLNMPIQTAGLNQLERSKVPDGSTVMSASRQIFAGIGTALFITIMTLTQDIEAGDTLVKGINNLFFVATFVAIIGVILSVFINEKERS